MQLKLPLSYDGFGINNGDEYKTRIAFFIGRGWESHELSMKDRDYLGRLFEKSPELLSLLKDATSGLVSFGVGSNLVKEIDQLVDYIEKGA